jgi:hypothetical protein
MQKKLIVLVVGLVAALAAQAAFATTISVSYDDPANPGSVGLGVSLNDGEVGEFIQNPDGTQTWRGDFEFPNVGRFEWDFLLDGDPFVAGTVGVINNTNATGTFTFEVGVPVTINLPAGSPMSGSSSISINDSNNNGAATVSAPAGGSIYEGRVNGAAIATLFDDPYSLSPPFPPTTISDDASFSGVSSTALNVGDTLSVKHTFVLSARDSATGNSNFAIIPEPSSVVLLGMAAIACLAIGIRRGR